ncbi:tryptophan synthase subunit alpha [Streptomyces sp. NPDC013740]|uniref:tryptophan synthase subunit alpha n=1 Tax=Streptomyces sp. NPDC013740 TaxID=3364867 RepID=UPI0036F7F205
MGERFRCADAVPVRDLTTKILHASAAYGLSRLRTSPFDPLLKQALARAGAAGVILPDLPIEEANDWLTAAQRVGLHTVFVVAPATNDARLTRICSAAGGMLYAPAVPGITGSTCPLDPALPAFVHRLRTATDLPIGVGIGISTPAQPRQPVASPT